MSEHSGPRLDNTELFSALALPASERLRKKITDNAQAVLWTVTLLVMVMAATSILKAQAPIPYPVLAQFFPNAAALALVVGICIFPERPTFYALLAFLPGFALTVILAFALHAGGPELSLHPVAFIGLSLVYNLGLGLIMGQLARMVFHHTDQLLPGISPDITLMAGVFVLVGVVGGTTTYLAHIQVPFLLGLPVEPAWHEAAFVAALRVMRGALIAVAILAIVLQSRITRRDLPHIGLGLAGFGLLIVVQHYVPGVSSEILPLAFALVLRILMKFQVAVLTALLGLVGNAVITSPALGQSFSVYVVSSLAMCMLMVSDLVLMARRSQEEQRDRNIRRLLVSQEVSKIGFFLYLTESRSLMVDGPGRRILGLSETDGLSDLLARIDPEKRAELTRILTTQSGRVTELNTLLQPKAPGEAPQMVRLYFQNSMAPAERPAVFGSIVDVSLQYETESTLNATLCALQTEKALQERLFAVISHEMRSPASIIQILTEKLIQTPAQTPDIAPRIQRLNAHLLAIMEDVRLVMRPEETARLTLEPVALVPLLRTMAEDFGELAQQHRMRIDLALQEGADQTVMIDPMRIRQVVGNLVRNAILHSKGSQVMIRASLQRSLEPAATQGGEAAVLAIEVCDDGRGIPEALRPSLFEPFSRAKVGSFSEAEGSGLGMYIVKSLVERMGGTLSLRSEGQGGAHLQLVLPTVITWPVALAPAPSAAKTGYLAGKSVLLVEDSPLLAEMTAERIRLAAARVIIAPTAEAALEVLSFDPPDLVVTDHVLPGQDGTAFVSQLRAKGFGGKIFSLSSDVSDQRAAAFLAAGGDAMMTKPFVSKLFAQICAEQGLASPGDAPDQRPAGRSDR